MRNVSVLWDLVGVTENSLQLGTSLVDTSFASFFGKNFAYFLNIQLVLKEKLFWSKTFYVYELNLQCWLSVA